MFYVWLSVICSVLVTVLLKLTRRFDIDVGQAIAWNYLLAALLATLLWRPSFTAWGAAAMPWPELIALGVLLPTIFLALAASVRHAGIVRSEVAQRLSLLLSLLAAYLFFHESLHWLKGAGAVIGLLALGCMVWRRESSSRAGSRWDWLFPLLVFVGFAAIDILFKRIASAGMPLPSALQAMFLAALLVAGALQAWRWWRRSVVFNRASLCGGVVLGLANFGNILFYLRAHQALPHQPSLVFASTNIGVVALGAVVGTLGFGERLARINVAGLLLALPALLLLTGVLA